MKTKKFIVAVVVICFLVFLVAFSYLNQSKFSIEKLILDNMDKSQIYEKIEAGCEKKISEKKIALTRSSQGDTETVTLTKEKSAEQVLTESEIQKLADYAIKLEEHYNKPQDIEFALEKREIYIVQTRPITTQTQENTKQKIEGKLLLSGLGASPGVISGKVKIIHDLNELAKIQKGDILVTEMTNPDMVVTMQKSSAIITNEGGITSHAAIVSREMGIPAVVGTNTATKSLKDGQIITVDGFNGKVYEGTAQEQKVEIKT